MRYLTIPLFLFSSLLLSAQESLVDQLSAISDMVGPVQVGKNMFEQDLSFDEDAPYRLRLFVTEIDSKGREEQSEYQINLALLDKNLVRWSDGRDRIQVNLRTGREPIIKVFEDGELDGYEKEAAILAEDVDNAREMEELLKTVIPLAKEAWENDSALPETYDELKAWVAEQITDVAIDDDRYEQSWAAADEHPNRFRFTVTSSGRSATTEVFQWNMADIHPPSIALNIKGKEVLVEMGTAARARYIRVEEDGEVQNYQDDLVIHCAEVDEAQLLSYALREMVPLAKEAEKGFLPALETTEAALESFGNTLVDFRQNDEEFRPSLSGDCAATFTLVEDDGKQAVESTYIFNFADLQEQSAEINVRGKNVTVQINTNGKKNYIYEAEDGEQQNYTNTLNFPAPDIPTAKLMLHSLLSIAEQCPKEVATTDWDGIQEAIKEIETVTEGLYQSVELQEGDACKWTLTSQEESGRRSKEERYEFNLYDLDHERIGMVIKGKTVSIEVNTNRNDEIIKNYTDGEELGYEKEFAFQVKDIATAKTVIVTLQEMIKECAQD